MTTPSIATTATLKNLKYFVLIFTVLSTSYLAQGQCPTGNISLNNQTEVNEFAATYPGCTMLNASLNIDGTAITNLDGLSVITSVGNDLIIDGNYDLENLDGLGALMSVGGNLIIRDNDDELTNLDGLNALTSVGGDLRIEDNDELSSIDGFGSLTTINGALRIEDNEPLTSVNGFGALTNSGSLVIIRNENLSTIEGLTALANVAGPFRIQDNEMLATCCGFFPILDANGVEGKIVISSNLTGCNSQMEILEGGACQPIPTMSQWALLILGLCLTSMALVFMRVRSKATA